VSNKTDISQIKKYLQGKLDAQAMHQLERQAQDDPFLMDALEGYEATGVNSKQLSDLSARLQQRTEKKEARIIPWRILAAAASVVVMLTVGGLWFYNSKPEVRPLTARVDKTEVTPESIIQSPAVGAVIDSIIKDKSANVAVLKQAAPPAMRRKRIAASVESAPVVSQDAVITPQIFEQKDKAIAAAEPKKEQTDFSEMAVMNYARKKTAKADSSAKAPLAADLLEQVDLAKSSRMDQTTGATRPKAAQPQIGWVEYEKIINNNNASPDGKAGTVKVKFTVNGDGSLTDLKVSTNLSTEADQKAIDLIKNGPAWWGNVNGKSKQFTIKVEFHSK
jgi:TonB family protein